jgi:hypothetical protein
MDKALIHVQNNLESIKQEKENLEFWSARDLIHVLGYKEWRKFVGVIDKAKESCKISKQEVSDHFVGADKMVLTGSGAQRRVDDVLLTRHACYLVAQNGDPRKVQIALAQTYFAVQTRKQELLEKRENESKRIVSRVKLKETEKKIKEFIKTLDSYSNDELVHFYKIALYRDSEQRGLYSPLIKAIEQLVVEAGKAQSAGELDVLAVFNQERLNKQLVGGAVIRGMFKNKGAVQVVREGKMIGQGTLLSLRQQKKEAVTVAAPNECGVLVDVSVRIEVGDRLLLL